MTIPTHVDTSAKQDSGSAITPTMAAGVKLGDLLLLLLQTRDQAITVSGGTETWTQVTGSPVSVSGLTRLTVFWAIASQDAPTSPTTSDSGDHQLGRITAIRGVNRTTPIHATQASTEAVSDTSGSVTGLTTTRDDCLIVSIVAGDGPDANNNAEFSGWTNASLASITERGDNSTASGAGGSLGHATGGKAAAGAVNATTVTLATSAQKAMLMIAVAPEITGSAALTGAGSLAASGQRTRFGTAALSGAGSLAATGQRTVFGTAALSGSGSLDATGKRTVAASAALSGAGSLAATAKRTTFGTAALTGTGALLAVVAALERGRVQVSEPHWLAATIELPGRGITFGPEEDSERMPYDMEFSTQLPGGHGPASMVVPRPEGLDPVDIPIRAPAYFYGPGGRRCWEGRVANKPRFGVNEITVEFEGWSAALDDDLFRQLYVSRDLARFQPPALQRRIDLIDALSPHQQDAQPRDDDSIGPGLRLAVQGSWSGLVPRCEAWLDAGSGLRVAAIEGFWTGWNDTGWILTINGADDDMGTGSDTGSDIYTLALGTFSRTFDEPKRWIWLEWYYNSAAAGGEDSDEFGVNVRGIAYVGDHGLDLYATADDGARGVRGDDALRHGLATACPFLNTEDIDPATFIIPDLVIDGWDGRVRQLVDRVTALGGAVAEPNDWGCWGRRFFHRAPGSFGKTYRVRLDEGVELIDQGEDSGQMATAMIATFTDANGHERAAGYPGSGADIESALLVDTRSANPIVRAESVKVITVPVGRTSPDGAVLLGALALRDATRVIATGAYALPSLPGDEAPFYLMAGDNLQVMDENAGTVQAENVVQTNYRHSEGKVEAHVGATPKRLDVELARLAALTG